MTRYFLYSLTLFATFLLTNSCNRYIPDCERHYWRYERTCCGCRCFDSARIHLPPPDPCHCLVTEFIRGPTGERLYISTLCYQLTPLDTSPCTVEISFRAGKECRLFSGHVLQGGQKILMNEEARHYLVQHLLAGQCVEIQASIFSVNITPSHFCSAYSRMQKTIP